MRRSIAITKRAVVAALALSLLPALPAPIFQGSPALAAPLKANPQIQVEYLQPKCNAADSQQRCDEFTAIYAWLRVRRPLEEIQTFLAPLRLSRPIKIQVDACGGADRRGYVSGGPVTVCYELINKIQQVAAGIKDNDSLKQTVIVGTFTQAVLHELAYGIFDVLQVPVWGREDDAADRLAAFVALQFSQDVARTAIVGAAEFFLLSGRIWTGSAFADPGSPEGQRFYNFLCIAYGGDPLSFGYLARPPQKGQDPVLPIARTANDGCRYEYEQVRKAFNLRIMPYIDADLLLQVKAQQWYLPGELSK
jgi:hypothetical protein